MSEPVLPWRNPEEEIWGTTQERRLNFVRLFHEVRYERPDLDPEDVIEAIARSEGMKFKRRRDGSVLARGGCLWMGWSREDLDEMRER